MPSIYRNTGYNMERGVYVLNPVDAAGNKLLTITSTYTTKEFKVDLPPGMYAISLTVNASMTGTTTTLSAFKPYANSEQTRNCTTPLVIAKDGTYALTETSVTFPAAQIGKHSHIIATGSTGSTGTIPHMVLAHGFRFLVTRGTAAAGERCEVVVTAAKLG